MNEAIFGFIGVIVGAIIPWAKEAWTARSQRAKNAHYLAVRVVCVLEDFADQCAKVVADDGYGIDGRPAGLTKDGEEFCEVTARLPDQPDFPADVDWKSIDSDLMSRALMLGLAQRRIDQEIHDAFEFSTLPDNAPIFKARRVGYAKLGMEAQSVSNLLREKYGIQKSEIVSADRQKLFRETLVELESGEAAQDDYDLSSEGQATHSQRTIAS